MIHIILKLLGQAIKNFFLLIKFILKTLDKSYQSFYVLVVTIYDDFLTLYQVILDLPIFFKLY